MNISQNTLELKIIVQFITSFKNSIIRKKINQIISKNLRLIIFLNFKTFLRLTSYN